MLAAFALALGPLGLRPAEAVTVSFLTLAFAQLWHVFDMREPGSPLLANEITRNPWVWGALALCSGLLLAAVAIPGARLVLQIAPLDALRLGTGGDRQPGADVDRTGGQGRGVGTRGLRARIPPRTERASRDHETPGEGASSGVSISSMRCGRWPPCIRARSSGVRSIGAA